MFLFGGLWSLSSMVANRMESFCFFSICFYICVFFVRGVCMLSYVVIYFLIGFWCVVIIFVLKKFYIPSFIGPFDRLNELCEFVLVSVLLFACFFCLFLVLFSGEVESIILLLGIEFIFLLIIFCLQFYNYLFWF